MRPLHAVVLALAAWQALPAAAYPLDGYADTGIRRLEASRLADEGKDRGPHFAVVCWLGFRREKHLSAASRRPAAPRASRVASRPRHLLLLRLRPNLTSQPTGLLFRPVETPECDVFGGDTNAWWDP